jgi:hypothetical protein
MGLERDWRRDRRTEKKRRGKPGPMGKVKVPPTATSAALGGSGAAKGRHSDFFLYHFRVLMLPKQREIFHDNKTPN